VSAAPAAASIEKPVVSSPPPTASTSVVAEIVRSIVADKTGYPSDMLDMDMDLEAELGIDSIKQVEILSALRERLPDMPRIEPAELAALRTLAQIANAIGGADAMPVAAQAVAPAARPATASNGAAPSSDMDGSLAAVAETVRAIVADKTGYPPDMLDMDMDLEAELGIDSIKQVEILSALRERLPDMPRIEPAELAALRTLAQIASAIAQGSGAAAPAPAPAPSPASNGSASPADRAASLAVVAETVRSIVADKTGYPPDMLDMDMDLEAELGIDSIKQVEILSALRERLPDMPRIEPAELAGLRTLAQIANAIAHGAAPAAAATAHVSHIDQAAAFAERAAASGLYRQAVELAATAPVKPKIRISSQDRIEITSDAKDIADALVEAFGRYGLLACAVETPSENAQAVVSTSGLAATLAPIEMHRRALAAARVAAPVLSERGGWFVVLQDTGGRFGRTLHSIDDALRGGLTGLAKTAAQEWPRAMVRAIDIEIGGDTAAAVAQRLTQEILFGGANIEIGLTKDGGRYVPVTRPIAYAGAGHRLSDGERIVVSGGARGITAAIVQRLAAVAKLRLLLLGRSARLAWPADIAPDADARTLRKLLATKMRATARDISLAEISAHADALDASREIDRTLAGIRAAGSEAVYAAVDITDAGAVSKVVGAFRQAHGSVGGLIHGAGVIADKLIADKTDAQFERVFRTKVDGFRALWSALGQDDIAFVALFASVAARFGNPGQADYAMANEVLNRAAWSVAASRPNTRVMSFNWGPWLGGMVNDGVRAQFEARGIPIIPPEIGIEAFLQELAHQGPPEVVFAGRADAVLSGASPDATAFMPSEAAASLALASQA
jgi:acyl carrier protein/NADP-dependent 3-hydroxy acid dehydrogenase YdfG